MRTIVSRLEALLMADDTEAVDYFESVEKDLSACMPAADYNNLKKFLVEYEFDAALRALNLIMQNLH